ncbi:unnamed protein product [Tuber aestivum]|uniref:FAD-binding PCMH-type domain-containing protein n=1 Tax=Tuber aestivum TaxID=59557 RepID=A0A292PU48_9PEZI|nr:unnamed protein product [Tuber aestivum]
MSEEKKMVFANGEDSENGQYKAGGILISKDQKSNFALVTPLAMILESAPGFEWARVLGASVVRTKHFNKLFIETATTTTTHSTIATTTKTNIKPIICTGSLCRDQDNFVPGHPFAVRSGRYLANPGWANTDTGIVSHSAGKTVASIGPGNWWGAVYEELEPYGVGVLGGRVPDVGVAGLPNTKPSGISYFTNGCGFALDNIKNFQVDLSTGDIVDANPDENLDLFWGLKGGLEISVLPQDST